MKKTLISIGSIALIGLPALVLADGFETSYIESLIRGGQKVIGWLVIFLVSLAVVWFIWNVIRYAMSEDEGGKEKAKSQMIWGIVAIAVIVSVWGIVGILQGVFGLNNSNGVNDVNSNFQNMIPGGQNLPQSEGVQG